MFGLLFIVSEISSQMFVTVSSVKIDPFIRSAEI